MELQMHRLICSVMQCTTFPKLRTVQRLHVKRRTLQQTPYKSHLCANVQANVVVMR